MKFLKWNVLLAIAAGVVRAQQAVPVTQEHHHHQVYSDTRVRCLNVIVNAHDSTLLHQHDHDYVWVSLGPADLMNAVLGRPEAHIQYPDGSVHYSRGGFAHVARNLASAEFHNVTIELLKPQTNPRNLCDQVLANEPGHCETAQWKGGEVRPEFSTDQTRVSIVRIPAGGSIDVPASALVVAVDPVKTGTRMLRASDLVTSAARVENPGKSAARVMAVEFIGR